MANSLIMYLPDAPDSAYSVQYAEVRVITTQEHSNFLVRGGTFFVASCIMC